MHMTDPEVELISRSNFAFSNALHEQLRINGEEGNLVFSPFSLGLVLLMARFGARGMTAQQLDRVLNPSHNVTMTLDDLVPMIRGCFKVLEGIQNGKSRDYNVTVANRMFTGLGFNVKDEFKSISRATLDIKVKQLDFTADGGRPAAEAINSWVSNKTNGKFNEIISSDILKNQTQVILVNTIHFMAPWKLSFQPRQTRNATFHLNSNEQTQVNMMTAEDQFPYADLQNLNATVVVIPYKGERFSMHIYVPKEKDGLNDFLHALKNTSMDQIRAQIRKPGNCEEVHLSLPRFKIQSELKLVEPLRKMGAEDMFSSRLANFTGISDDVNVYVSDVVQKAFIAVDEAGTEAAAASSIQAGVTCFPSITIIKADRPFYFQIVDERMGVVLFAGTVRRPDASKEANLVSGPVEYNYDDEYPTDTELPTPATTKAPTLTPVTVTTTQSSRHEKVLTGHNQGAHFVTPVVASTPLTVIQYADSTTETTALPVRPLPKPISTTPSAVQIEETTTGGANEGYEPLIIFATFGGGIKAYSDVTGKVTTIVVRKENFTGAAWDSINQRLYFSSANAIYRTQIDGTNVQAVLNTNKYGAITGLAFDWKTGNLYGVSDTGFIFACRPLADGTLSCVTVVVDRQTRLSGIDLNPNEGKMYWTEYAANRRSRIVQADLDGTSPVMIVRGLFNPSGITVDLNSSRILWTDYGEHDVQSWNPAKRIKLRQAAKWTGKGPTGIVVHNDKAFWGTFVGQQLRSGSKFYNDIHPEHILYTGSPISQLTLATVTVPNITRLNHCNVLKCTRVCALTPDSARCLR